MAVIQLAQWAVRDVGGRVALMTICGSVSLAAWRTATASLARHFAANPYGAIVVDIRDAQLHEDVLARSKDPLARIEAPLTAPVAFLPSEHQREPLRQACWQLALHHGLLRMVFSSPPGALEWARNRAAALGLPRQPTRPSPESRAWPANTLAPVETGR